MCKNKIKGFSLLEILIVIGIIAIFSTGFITVYFHLLKSERTGRLFVKSEVDLQAFVSQLKKIFSAIGYGIPLEYFKVSPVCSQDAVISYNGTNLCFLSTFLRQTPYAGCWWVYSTDSFTRALSRFSNNCPSLESLYRNPNHNWFMILDDTKRLKFSGIDDITTVTKNQGDIIIYLGKGSSNNPYFFPQDFLVNIYLNNLNLPSVCANNTANLYIKIGNDIEQPLISCVGNFQVVFIKKDGTYTSNISEFINDFSKLWGIRVCFLLQIGGRRDSPEVLPLYSSKCGSYPVFSNWQYYRWKVIEEDIPFYNIINWKLE